MHAVHTHVAAGTFDQNILDALESSRDRIGVLRLEQDILAFLADDARQVLEVPSLNGYQRLLAHKTGDYYQLTHVSDPSRQVLLFHKHPWSKVPATRLCDYPIARNPPSSGKVPSGSPAPSIVKIMKRDSGKLAAPPIRETSPAMLDPAQLRDKEKSDKEERYRLARARIFQGVDESTDKAAPSDNKGNTRPSSRSNSRDARQKANRRRDPEAPNQGRGYIQPDQTPAGTVFYDGFLPPLEGVDAVQQRHQQYFQPDPVSRNYQRPVTEPRTFPSVWNPRSSTPLSMANLATLEAQTAKQSSPPTLFSKPNSLSAVLPNTPPSRSLAPPVTSTSNLWGPPSTKLPISSRNASAMGLNLGASPWTPKTAAASRISEDQHKPQADDDGEDDPTNVLRGLALDGK